MSPYAYVSNNPVSLVDPTGHTAMHCGGAYQPVFNTRNWQLVMYGVFVWNQYPLPQEVNPIEPKEYIWGNWNGEQFAYASGEVFLSFGAWATLTFTYQKLDMVLKWLRTNLPEFSYYESRLQEVLGAINYYIKANVESIYGHEGGVWGNLPNWLALVFTPQVGVCGKWTVPSEDAMMVLVASGILHEIAEMSAEKFFKYKGAGLAAGPAPADDLATLYVNQYIGQGFFDPSNFGRNMDWWWQTHQVWPLSIMARYCWLWIHSQYPELWP